MELQVFNSTEFGSVRTATVNGEVMFVGKDVADISVSIQQRMVCLCIRTIYFDFVKRKRLSRGKHF